MSQSDDDDKAMRPDSVLFQLLRKDHADADGILERLAGDARSADRQSDLDRLTASLEHHMAAEERTVYPVLAKVPSLATFVDRMRAQHAGVRAAVALAAGLDVADPAFGGAVAAVRKALREHVIEEENALFEHAAEHLAGELEAMAIEFESVNREAQGSYGV
jgi:iron-sulfur cluster repair protein YtfE (RIC family)